MTKEQLDARLRQVVRPGPVIMVGPAHPIARYPGYDDPYPGWYLGARVEIHPGMGEDCTVVEL